jgi:phospholipase/lecithinase/hemolysin
MNKKLLGALALVVAMGLPAAANASLQTLSDLFVFGDSLSDGGNSGIVSRDYTGGTVTYPPFPYYNGQYSNGPVAVEYLWKSYNPGNTSFKPSLSPEGGTNYAIGGATTGLESFNSVNPSAVLPTTPPLDLRPAYAQKSNNWQLNAFASQLAGGPTFDPATSLFVVWLFPNDVFYSATGSTPGTVGCPDNATVPCSGVPLASGLPGVSQLIGNGVSNILTTVAYLASLGAQHFLVPNMPDLGKTPEFPGNSDLSDLSAAFNDYLKLGLTDLDTLLTSAEIVQFDTYRFFNDAIANPGKFGFTNTTGKCVDNISNGLCNPDDNTWLFWDGVHPTTYAHSILGAEFRAAVPEPESILLLAIGLLGIFVTRRRAA